MPFGGLHYSWSTQTQGAYGQLFASWVPPACLSSRFQLVFPLKASQHVFGITSPTFHHIDLDFISLPGSELEKKTVIAGLFTADQASSTN